jgi:hypothetical protein
MKVGFVVLPLEKLVEWIELIDRSTTKRSAITLAIIAIIAIWVIVGIAIAIMLLFVTIKKPKLVKTRLKIPICLITTCCTVDSNWLTC